MKTYVASFLFFLSLNICADISMRRCMLLPILDHEGGRERFHLFEEMEKYLKNGRWCSYRSNAEILDILQGHKNNLQESLNNGEVLKLVAEKTQSGSLLKIEIDNRAQGIKVTLQVIGPSGEDIYFRKEKDLPTNDPLTVSQTLKEWLSTYGEQIPYDGQIIGVLGDQFSVGAGRHYGLMEGDEIVVKRAVGKKRHPLLKEIIDWETRIIATGSIFHSSQHQSQGKAQEYSSDQKIQVGDWVSITKKKQVTQNDESYYGENKHQFGKLGLLQTLFHLGSGGGWSNTSGEETNKIGGLVLGADFKFELWVTRNFFANFSFGKSYGSYKKKAGSVHDNSLNESSVTANLGYKYLPLGFFYGPQVDTYLGYGRRIYGLDTQKEDGFTEFRFEGFLMGIKGSVPLVKDVRTFIELNLIFGPDFEEDTEIYGEHDSSSHTSLSLGVDYAYSEALGLNMEIGMVNTEAGFKNPLQGD